MILLNLKSIFASTNRHAVRVKKKTFINTKCSVWCLHGLISGAFTVCCTFLVASVTYPLFFNLHSLWDTSQVTITVCNWDHITRWRWYWNDQISSLAVFSLLWWMVSMKHHPTISVKSGHWGLGFVNDFFSVVVGSAH